MTSVIFTIFGILTAFLSIRGSRYTYFLLPVILPFEKLLINTGVPGINILTLILLPLYFSFLMKDHDITESAIHRSIKLPIILLILSTLFTSLTPLLFPAKSFDLYLQLIELKRWFTYFILYFIYVVKMEDDDFARKIILCIGFAYCLETFHSVKDMLVSGRERLYGSFLNPNELGAYLSSFWVIALISSKDTHISKKMRYLYGSAFLLGILCVLRTLSRGSYLSLVASCFAYLYFTSKKLFVLSLFGLFFVGLSYQMILPDFMVARIDETFEQNSNYYWENDSLELQAESAGARVLFWKSGFRMFQDNPLFGVGFHQFPAFLPKYGAGYGLTENRPPHNMYVKMMAEQGIIGIIIFLYMMIRAYCCGLKLMRFNDQKAVGIAFCTLIVGLLTSMMFGDRFFNGVIVGNFFIFWAIVAYFLNKEEEMSTS